jgi:hypothetical protein
MQYNSQREQLILPEYGRNIQQLVRHAKTIENKEERQVYIERIIKLMMQVNPQKITEELIDRLWKHVFIIAEYDLDVTPPNGLQPNPEDDSKLPEKIGYPNVKPKFPHYGQNVQKLINKCASLEDGYKKEEFKKIIGSYMKMAYKTWNSEHYVSDEIIKGDLKAISKGELILAEDVVLANINTHSGNGTYKRRNKKNYSRGDNRDRNRNRGRSQRRKR